MNKIEVGKSASPNIKAVRSKIGSLDNATHKAQGGKVKIESKKLDFTKTTSRISAKNDTYAPGGGDKKVGLKPFFYLLKISFLIQNFFLD